MSDENEQPDEQPNEMPDLVFVQMPPQLQHAIAQHQMNAESVAHDVQDFFNSLNEDQLRTFRGILHVIQNDGYAGTYYMGMAGATMHQRFGVCLACSKKHDEELQAMASPAGVEVPVNEDTKAKSTDELMKEYGLKIVTTDDDKFQLVCSNCGMNYVSLDDRMLRAPGIDGCTGCQEKSAWG